MSTSSISAITGQNTQSQSLTSQGTQGLGQDAFLNLLVTQLKNQDPLQPTDDKEFIAQLAQFSSLEQAQNMNQTLQSFTKSQPILQASNLIGHTVTAVGSNSSDLITGKVTSVRFDSGQVILKVGDKDVPAGNITAIS
jgi:flagellar basal-body rod modification protein FlgD